MNISRQDILFHSFIWIFICSQMLIFGTLFAALSEVFAMIINTLIFGGLMVYLTLIFSIPKLLDNHIKTFIIQSLLLFILLTFLRISTYDIFKIDHFLAPYPVRKGLLLGLQLILLAVIFSAYPIVKQWFENKATAPQWQQKRLSEELRFLKSQINPHFLFNTLNNIYSLAYRQSDKTAPMVARLAKLMRYLLYEGAAVKVSLRREREMLKDYIALQELKGEAPAVDFYTEGVSADHKIAPMLLINFLENCFKHTKPNAGKSAWIKVQLRVVDDTLIYQLENSIAAKHHKRRPVGLGIESAKRLLELNYPNSYTLEINEENQMWMVQLSLDLNAGHLIFTE